MLVFSTRLPIKNEVQQEDCMKLFIKWVVESPHYPIDCIDYDFGSYKDFDYKNENVTFSVRHFKNNQVELSACRLENREDRAVWINDCIFLNEQGNKSLLIQLNCNLINYDSQLPNYHKPHIVHMFVEAKYCRDDAGIPISDTPIASDGEFYDVCVNIMNGTLDYSMPMVYISCDYWGKTEVSAVYLARQLAGVAHVFVEKTEKPL